MTDLESALKQLEEIEDRARGLHPGAEMFHAIAHAQIVAHSVLPAAIALIRAYEAERRARLYPKFRKCEAATDAAKAAFCKAVRGGE